VGVIKLIGILLRALLANRAALETWGRYPCFLSKPGETWGRYPCFLLNLAWVGG
jgi:hypothetical protein